MRNSNSWRRKGFTLIEIMLVIGILVMLATVGVVVVTRMKGTANRQMAQVMVNDTARAVSFYFAAMNKYPTTEEGLNALITAPDDAKLAEKWRNGGGPWLKDGVIPSDPWDQPLKYELLQTSEGSSSATPTGPVFRVWSMGPDMQDGTEDDISSSPKETSAK